MRILLITLQDPRTVGSGISTYLYNLSQSLSNLGCEVHVMTFKQKYQRVLENVQIHYFNFQLPIPLIKGLRFCLFSFRKISELIRNHRIDLVHGQSASCAGFALLRDNKRIPLIVTAHGTSFGEITSHLKAPVSCINKRGVYDAVAVQPTWAFLTNIEYKLADRVIAVSESLAKEVIAYYGLPKEKVVIVHNGVRLPDVNCSSSRSENIIMSVGRLTWRKGFSYLIEAMPSILDEYPDARLFIVGSGEYKIFLEKLTRKLGLEKAVLFFGRVTDEMLYSLYSRARVYVQPSLYEPFGITVLEAMAMGKTVVASRVGGIPEAIVDGKCGVLVEPASNSALAGAIKKVLSDPGYAEKLAIEARKWVRGNFSWEIIGRKTLEVYEDALNNIK